MRLIADTHAHTIASGHAYSSLIHDEKLYSEQNVVY